MNTKIVLAALGLVFFANPAYAYIDPGSGSAIMSAIIAIFVALGILIKAYWYKLRSLLGFKSKAPEEKVDGE